MNPIKKDMPLTNTLFPFLLVYKDTKMPDHELPNHVHEWHEIVYVYAGSGVLFIDNQFHNMKKGDLFCIPANTIHRAMPDATNPITSTAVFFGTQLLTTDSFGDSMPMIGMLQEWRVKHAYKLELTSRQQDIVEHKLMDLHQEMHQRRLGFRQAIALQLQQLLLMMTRMVFDDTSISPRVPDSVGPNWIAKALQYIDANLCEPIYLSQLADLASVSQTYFSKVFKQMTGLNLIEYITTKRIVKAKELLERTNDTIACVSEDCGFNSLPHFHRTFLKHTGMTPSVYRNCRR